MFEEPVSDNRLAFFLQQYLTKNAGSDINHKLRGLRLCGSKLIHQPGVLPGVFLMSNGEDAKYFGLATCHSVWACPKCSPIEMAKKGARIGAAIDALAKWKNLSSCMFTFTIPHHKFMLSCKQATQILDEAWRKFSKETSEKRLRSGYMKGANIYGKFRDDLNVKYWVKIFEYTWSNLNNWHPHIHALFWVDNKKFNQIANYEEKLMNFWWHCAEKATYQVMKQYVSDEEAKKIADFLYADNFKYCSNGHRSLNIAKNPDGTIKKQSSSLYISGFNGKGWGAENELTGANYKQARENHFTPYQLLVAAYDDPTKRDYYMQLYIEYALVTRGKRRLAFSNNDINSIIDSWLTTAEYVEIYKKKITASAEKPWKVICWFDTEQWLLIHYLDNHQGMEIRAILLRLALHDNAKAIIQQYFDDNNIPIKLNEPHEAEEFIENRIFANKLTVA